MTETVEMQMAHQWTDGGTRVLILRRCNADMTSYKGFVWPSSGEIEFADFSPEATCGGGGHGWPWGMGLGEGSDYDIIGDKWLVVAAIPGDIIGELEGGYKCKIKRGEVIYCGSFSGAWALVNSGRHRLIEEMSRSPASSGDSSKAASSGKLLDGTDRWKRHYRGSSWKRRTCESWRARSIRNRILDGC